MAKKKAKKNKAKAKKARAKAKGKSKVSTKKKGLKTRGTAKKKNEKVNIARSGVSSEAVKYETRGLGAKSAGQAGDTQGLPKIPVGDNDSVEELLEEGQTFEAEILEGVENAGDADKSEVRTRQLPADDVPEEYLEKD